MIKKFRNSLWIRSRTSKPREEAADSREILMTMKEEIEMEATEEEEAVAEAEVVTEEETIEIEEEDQAHSLMKIDNKEEEEETTMATAEIVMIETEETTDKENIVITTESTLAMKEKIDAERDLKTEIDHRKEKEKSNKEMTNELQKTNLFFFNNINNSKIIK